MKKYVFFALIVFFTINGLSQNYQALLKEGNKWNVLQELYATCDCSWATTFSFSLSNDTLIEDVSYKKLMCEIIAAENNGIVSNIVYTAALREDIDNQKVYVRYPEKEEQLLYDFNPQIGDTIFIYELSDMEKIIRYVKGIDLYSINEYSGKKISVCDTTFLTQYNRPGGYYYTSKTETFLDDWYEGIGSLKSLVVLEDNYHTDAMELLCFWNNDDLIYHHEYRDECIYAYYHADVEEISEDHNIMFVQTPGQGELVFDRDLDISIIHIYNLTGDKIVESTQKIINISNFTNGIYLLKIQLSGNTTHVKKWAKH